MKILNFFLKIQKKINKKKNNFIKKIEIFF